MQTVRKFFNLDIARSLRIRAISICDAEDCGVQASAANRTGGVNPAAPLVLRSELLRRVALESGALRPFGRKLPRKGRGNFRVNLLTKFYRAHPHVFSLLILILLVWAAYGKSLNYDFVWDDHGLIVDNEQIKSASHWHQFFSQSFWKLDKNVDDPTRSFYRPLITLSYFIDYSLWNIQPRGFHLTNLTAHIICAFIVYRLVFSIIKTPLGALLASGIWAVHPVHVENVCWISGRTDIFCGIFFFLSFCCYLRWIDKFPRRHVQFFGICLCYMFALLSKEMTIALPLLVMLHYSFLRREQAPWKPFILLCFMLAAVTVLYLFARNAFLGKITGKPAFGSFVEILASIPMVFCKYLGLLITLTPTDPHHSEEFTSNVWSVRSLLFQLISMGYFALVLWRYRRGMIREAFLLMWIPLTLIPVFFLGSFGDVIYADRFLYIPSVGFALFVVTVASGSDFKRLSASRWLKLLGSIFYGVILASLLILSRVNSSYWENNLSLFHRATQTSPDSPYIHFNLGNSLLKLGAYKEACKAYQGAVDLLPSYAQAHANMGACLNKLGRYKEAIESFKKAMKHGDFSHILFSNLGDSYRKLGNMESAKICYRQSLALRPDGSDYRATASVHNNLAECLVATGSLRLAHKHLIRALEMHPAPAIYNNLGLLYLQQEEYEKAIKCLNKAMAFPSEKLSPDREVAIHYNLARALYRQKGAAAALWHARKALDFIAEGYGPCNSEDMRQQLEKIIR